MSGEEGKYLAVVLAGCQAGAVLAGVVLDQRIDTAAIFYSLTFAPGKIG